MNSRKIRMVCLAFLVVCGPSWADAASTDAPARIYRDRVTPHWFADNSRFWYRNDLRNGGKEFVLVDAGQGTRAPAFDHVKLASALSKATGTDYRSDRLPFDTIEFSADNSGIEFGAGAKYWHCSLSTYAIAETPHVDKPATPRPEAPRRSTRTGDETYLTLVNRTANPVELFWLDTEGGRQSYGKILPGGEHRQHTFAGHVWLVADSAGRELSRIEATAESERVEITGGSPATQPAPANPPGQQRRGTGQRGGANGKAPDEQRTAFIKESNVWIRTADGKETQLSTDGSANNAYGLLNWSPDSKSLIAFRVEPGDRKEVYLVQSSPPGGGRAQLQTRAYDLPGDKFAVYELNIFDLTTQKQIKPPVEKIDFGTPRLHWSHDGAHFTYQKNDRGHQRLRVIEVDLHTGDTRSLIDEQSATFIWTAHTDATAVDSVSWLQKSDELIHASERDGWRHLYLIDMKDAKVKNPITHGEWVVRGIDLIDEERREIWFRASGVFPDQDPYLIHYGRVNFDGTGLMWLTTGNGTHTLQFSPDRKYFLDTYSRVDRAPVNELRRAADGKLACQLEEADTTDLQAIGWETPEVFSAKGRDGKTDIWGIICRPRRLDPAKKYPIVEDIYAGPHGSFVPKTFSAGPRYESLNRLGFVVVKIDGMGTANRSKAFQDVCWHNLKDGGFEDRILWMKAAAARYPYLDLEHVGIYGTSAGGQNAAAAVLFHPEFYKAAVANCGCHDNRMDKASWNEQWMGFMAPDKLWSKSPDNWYAQSSNIENAYRLRGHLFLIVGELDTNVPPETTYRFADALIKAGKDFDFLTVPNGGHGAGGAYAARRREDFFIRHLMGKEPPDRNAMPSQNP